MIKSSREVDEKYLDYLSIFCGKNMVTIGPLIQESKLSTEDNDHVGIIKFRNKKDQSSVAVVSFGIECFFSSEEREEIAYGLDLSNVNFIWAHRFPAGNEICRIEGVLPGDLLKG